MSEEKKQWQQNIEDYGFKVKIPNDLLATFNVNNSNDPLTKQFIPNIDERNDDGKVDPLEEHEIIHSGIIQKYKHRVLITTTGACAVHCRYCFRRHFPYETNSILKHLDQLVQYLKDHPDINEVILSGGDPLMLKNHHLEKIFNALDTIKTIKIIRLHTRIPTVLPKRIDLGFQKLVQKYRHWHWVVVTHVNHAKELNEHNKVAINTLKSLNITMLNQAVLLKGINNSVTTLKALSLALFNHGILPYYLHQLDPVKGAIHFEVSINEGKKIIKNLQTVLPGYLIPKYVQEQPGQPNKTIL